MQRAGQFLEVYSLDHVGSRYGTDGIKFSSKHLYLLSLSLSMNSESLKIPRSFFSYMVHPPVLELHVHVVHMGAEDPNSEELHGYTKAFIN